MAITSTELHETVVVPDAVLQGLRINWGGVWSGFLVAAGIFLLLSMLGLAVGMSTADIGLREDLNASALGIGAAIWSGVSLLIALFIGGLVATRGTLVYGAAAGVIDGVLIWVLAMFALIYMAGSGVGMVTSGAMGALGGVAEGVVRTATGTIDAGQMSSGNVDQILQRLGDPKTVRTVAAVTGMSQEQARAQLSAIAQRVQAARSDPAQAAAAAREGLQQLASQAGRRVEQAAAQAQPYASATLWGTVIAMVLALLAAIGGAMTGRRQVERRLDDTLEYADRR